MKFLYSLRYIPHGKAVSFGCTCKSFLNTWTSLATAFNKKPDKKLSLRFRRDETGLFGVPELTEPNGFKLLQERAISETHELVSEACDPRRKRKLVDIFDQLSDTLCRVADLAEFIRLAHPKDSFALAAENACITISSIVEKLNTNRSIYEALHAVCYKGDIFPTTVEDSHVAMLFLLDFELSGIHLPEDRRKMVVALNDYILQLGREFSYEAAAPSREPLKNIPSSIRRLFPHDGGNAILGGLRVDSSDELVRETAFRLFLRPDEKREELLYKLLEARHQLATLCGFSSYSHRALRGSLAGDPQTVSEFISGLSKELGGRALEELEAMKKIKMSDNPYSKDIYPWDVPYYVNKLRRRWLGAVDSEICPYFSLGACMQGLNLLLQSIYGVSLHREEMEPGESWSPDVHKLAVKEEDGSLLGHIYCDFFERAGKPAQDCHFTIRGGRRLPDGSYQDPIVVVMLGLPSPGWGQPALLNPSTVDNLFHEMGHAMHSMFARTTHQHVSGTRCSTDFAEVPSVLMEYFASDVKVLSSFAHHYQTGEEIPKNLVNRLCASKHLFSCSEMVTQVFYSDLDQEYHSIWPPSDGCSTSDVLAKVQSRHSGLLPLVPDTAWQLRFGHLVGYGAKYYSYLMSRAVASRIWSHQFSQNPLELGVGKMYRNTCLAHGGGRPPSQLLNELLGEEPNPKKLSDSLIDEQDSHLEKTRMVLQGS
ncbi:mitochondrial intermediate peptidase [Ischnura elegans]|uniref:mitochondrial intermediate peptidase n=1 Tax=Ischnura elegans TaxID=197161 RepID=UPI001ED8A11E|nr:mitochondrial intermediate peptidase [Ischnura elegans]